MLSYTRASIVPFPADVDFAAREKVIGNELAELIQAQDYKLIL